MKWRKSRYEYKQWNYGLMRGTTPYNGDVIQHLRTSFTDSFFPKEVDLTTYSDE